MLVTNDHEKIHTTIVLNAVAIVESVLLIPHLASTEVIPAKKEDISAYINHTILLYYLFECV